jgi:hypothetical protein
MKRYAYVLSLVSAALLLLASCAPIPEATDAVSVTKALFTAINQGKAEAAANFFAKDGELITAFGQPQGAVKIHNFFKVTVIPLKTKVEIKDLKVDGENVTGTFAMTNNNTGNNSATNPGEKVPLMKLSSVVQEGKIKSMTWTTNK